MRYSTSNSLRVAVIVTGVIALATTMIACANSEATRRTGRVEHGLDRPTDETITRWADESLRLDPRIRSTDVDVRTLNGIAKLYGTVNSVQARSDAVLEVKKIAGVRGVIDELTIRPTDLSDDQITTGVVRRLTDNPAVRCEDLGVVVKDGAVTLHGKVASWNERDYASTLAGEVRGVRDVTNEMEISFLRPLTDKQNRDEIVAAIDRDTYLTGLPITVRVADGVATLEGKVGNAYEKERAETDTFRVGSVNRVNNQIEVEWWKERGVREGMPAATGDEIRRAVREALDQDLRIARPSDVTIKVADREVTLKGSVRDYYQETIALQDARDVVGVEKVVDLIDSDTSGRDDEAIASDLKLDLRSDSALDDRPIGVSVDDGVATLTGVVHSPFEKEHAKHVATSVPGVRSVVNDVVVQPAVGYSDEALREKIEGRLAANWKTRPISFGIHVAVEDGTATLTGDVESWSERLEAGHVARLVDGVADVNNDLKVVGPDPTAISRLNRRNDDSVE